MRRPRPGPARWRTLGRLLPAEIRTRVFDPAFSDLLRSHLTRESAGRAVPFGAQVVAMIASCLAIALPRVFVQRGSLTRFGRGVLWTASLAGLIWLVVLRLSGAYGPVGPS